MGRQAKLYLTIACAASPSAMEEELLPALGKCGLLFTPAGFVRTRVLLELGPPKLTHKLEVLVLCLPSLGFYMITAVWHYRGNRSCSPWWVI